MLEDSENCRMLGHSLTLKKVRPSISDSGRLVDAHGDLLFRELFLCSGRHVLTVWL